MPRRKGNIVRNDAFYDRLPFKTIKNENRTKPEDPLYLFKIYKFKCDCDDPYWNEWESPLADAEDGMECENPKCGKLNSPFGDILSSTPCSYNNSKFYGRYRCPSCYIMWASHRSWTGSWQKCKECKTPTYPHDMLDSDIAPVNQGLGGGSHNAELCQKCQQGGCSTRAKGYSKNGKFFRRKFNNNSNGNNGPGNGSNNNFKKGPRNNNNNNNNGNKGSGNDNNKPGPGPGASSGTNANLPSSGESSSGPPINAGNSNGQQPRPKQSQNETPKTAAGEDQKNNGGGKNSRRRRRRRYGRSKGNQPGNANSKPTTNSSASGSVSASAHQGLANGPAQTDIKPVPKLNNNTPASPAQFSKNQRQLTSVIGQNHNSNPPFPPVSSAATKANSNGPFHSPIFSTQHSYSTGEPKKLSVAKPSDVPAFSPIKVWSVPEKTSTLFPIYHHNNKITAAVKPAARPQIFPKPAPSTTADFIDFPAATSARQTPNTTTIYQIRSPIYPVQAQPSFARIPTAASAESTTALAEKMRKLSLSRSNSNKTIEILSSSSSPQITPKKPAKDGGCVIC